MVYPVTKLITQSYYLSGILSQKYQTISPAQTSAGLDLLNDLLAIKTADNRLIPYYDSYTFNAVIGQETYFIPRLIYPETATFNMQQNVRFSLMKQGRKVYFGIPRVNNITSLPGTVHVERTLGGSNMYIYFLPNSDYPITVWGKFSLESVTINQDLEEVMDRFYIVYLRYALGKYICDSNKQTFPQESELENLEEQITDISPSDVTGTKLSTLQDQVGMSWAYVNFPGWTPR